MCCIVFQKSLLLPHQEIFKFMSFNSTKLSPIPSNRRRQCATNEVKIGKGCEKYPFTPTTSKNFPLLTHKLTHRESYLVSMAMKKSPSHSAAGGGRKRFGDVWKEFEWGFAIKNCFMEVVHLKVFPFGRKACADY